MFHKNLDLSFIQLFFLALNITKNSKLKVIAKKNKKKILIFKFKNNLLNIYK